jgi:hypothetical protein
MPNSSQMDTRSQPSGAPKECSDWQVMPVVNGLFDEGRLIRNPVLLIDTLCQSLDEAGAPHYRLRTSFNTLHPEVVGRAFTWWRDDPVPEKRPWIGSAGSIGSDSKGLRR